MPPPRKATESNLNIYKNIILTAYVTGVTKIIISYEIWVLAVGFKRDKRLQTSQSAVAAF